MNFYEKWGVFIDYYPFIAPFVFIGTVVAVHSLYTVGRKYASRIMRKPRVFNKRNG